MDARIINRLPLHGKDGGQAGEHRDGEGEKGGYGRKEHFWFSTLDAPSLLWFTVVYNEKPAGERRCKRRRRKAPPSNQHCMHVSLRKTPFERGKLFFSLVRATIAACELSPQQEKEEDKEVRSSQVATAG